jgi:hypothetical protein
MKRPPGPSKYVFTGISSKIEDLIYGDLIYRGFSIT